jgi:hypothetical protein
MNPKIKITLTLLYAAKAECNQLFNTAVKLIPVTVKEIAYWGKTFFVPN